MITAIKLIGIFLGVLARSLSPYLRKLREGESGKVFQLTIVNRNTCTPAPLGWHAIVSEAASWAGAFN